MFKPVFSAFAMCALAFVGNTAAATYTNPVIPGDYPDPSVIRVGEDYYATATTSEWAPIFPIIHSRDLVNWKIIGSVFESRPEWSVGNYWAPEIIEHKGKYFMYYTARVKGGPLSIAVATADQPEGPWTDHGPFISQDAGSIDAFPIDDENGKRYLIWKEDGNSRNLPTPLWIAPLSADGTKLEGEMKEILRNDLPWEGNVVEGPFVMRRDGYFYLFYAANACCGNGCHYGVGVARAKKLLGPWEKNPRNPLVTDNDIWKCPGHGSLVQDDEGDWWFMYHAYHKEDSVFVGRQAVLDRIDWSDDGWPVINQGRGVAYVTEAPEGASTRHAQYRFSDDFTARELSPEWQWPQHAKPTVSLESRDKGTLELKPHPQFANEVTGGVLGIKSTSGDYTAITVIDRKSLSDDTAAGISAFGDMNNALGVAVRGSEVQLWRKGQGKTATLKTEAIPSSDRLFIRMTAEDGRKYKFAVSPDGQRWREVSAGEALDGGNLPPWDRGIRVALTVGGNADASARFDSLQIDSEPPKLRP